MEEQTTTSEKEVRNPLSYSGADLAARALSVEWLETDGLGGFACGTASGARTRKYHGWYAPAVSPPRGRLLVVAGCEEFVVAGGERTGISTQLYRGAVFPDGRASLASFGLEPFPTWLHRTDRFSIERSLCLPRGRSVALARWTNRGSRTVELTVRPLLAYRRLHDLQRESGFDAATEVHGDRAVVRPSRRNAGPRHPRLRSADRERARLVPAVPLPGRGREGLRGRGGPLEPASLEVGARPRKGSVGGFRSRRVAGRTGASLAEGNAGAGTAFPRTGDPPVDELAQRAESFLVETPDGGGTILAGFPWSSERGRDAMIAAPGLAVAVGRHRPFARVLNAFAARLQDGLLPNDFPEDGGEPDYGSIDAPLWFILAVESFGRARRDPSKPSPLLPAVREIVDAYRAGTRFGIRAGDGPAAFGRRAGPRADVDGRGRRRRARDAAARPAGRGQRAVARGAESRRAARAAVGRARARPGSRRRRVAQRPPVQRGLLGRGTGTALRRRRRRRAGLRACGPTRSGRSRSSPTSSRPTARGRCTGRSVVTC